MSDTQLVQLEPRHNPWHMYRAFVGIGIICAVIIVSVYETTLPTIKQNKRELLEQSLYQIFPQATQLRYFVFSDDEKFAAVKDSIERSSVFAAYDQQNSLIGIAIKARGMGYQDNIELLYGYIPEAQLVRGMVVLESRETPGLGNKIETEQSFLQNFVALDVKLNGRGDALLNPIEVVKPGKKLHAWQIDTISGATISSRAVGNILHASTRQWLPVIANQREVFAYE